MNRQFEKLLNSSHDERKRNVEGWEPGMPRQFPIPLDPHGIRFTNYRRADYHDRLTLIGHSDSAPRLQVANLPGSTPVPNWFLDDIMADGQVPHSVKYVFLYLYRQTVGWNRKDWEISLTEIMYATNVQRGTASYAVKVLVDCWGLFHKVRGRKGQHSSTFRYNSPKPEQIYDRCMAVRLAYGLQRGCPGARQLLDTPCTREVLAAGYDKLRQIRSGPGATYDEWFPE